MNYSDLIDPDNLTYSEQTFNQKPDEKLTIRRSFFDQSYFINFIPKQWKNKHPKSINTNWKARLSIHPEDFDKAWELIYPLLYQNVTAFKVINRNIIKKLIESRQKKLDMLLYYKLITEKDAKSLDHKLLKSTYYEVSQILDESNYSKWRLISFAQACYTKLCGFFIGFFLSKDNLFIRFKQKYEQLLEQRKQKMSGGLRLYEGMQFTIYMLPGSENKYQLMLKEIETLLIKEKIRPGVIYPTDRQIGIYSSIRHPGKEMYHPAISVDSYNPDDVNDPFDFLATLPTEEIIHEQDCQNIIQSGCSAQRIIDTLTTKKFISPAALKLFAQHKEEVVDYIKALPLNVRKKLITEILDKSTNPGSFFRVQRGIFKPQLGRGTLKQIENLSCSNEFKS